MPNVRKLTPEEVRAIERRVKGQRKLIEEEYDSILSEYDAGDYGEAELADDENRITVRNRLRAAANRRNLALDFRRTKGNMLRFRVVKRENRKSAAGDSTDSDATEAAPQTTGGGRRGRKKAEVA